MKIYDRETGEELRVYVRNFFDKNRYDPKKHVVVFDNAPACDVSGCGEVATTFLCHKHFHGTSVATPVVTSVVRSRNPCRSDMGKIVADLLHAQLCEGGACMVNDSKAIDKYQSQMRMLVQELCNYVGIETVNND